MKQDLLHIVLASSSPRRRELFSQFRLPLHFYKSDVDESAFQWDMEHIGESASALALLKAKTAQKAYPDSVIIGADTIVVHEGTLLGKPKNKQEAKQFLKSLSGQTHSVVSGCAVISKEKERLLYNTTLVTFFPLSDQHIDSYLETDIWKDKAGGYAIQGAYGPLFVRSIQGCFYNVMGFPLGALNTLLEEFNISLWDRAPSP